ncbi:MAG: hypothetical protein EXR54_07455 [Dehalococcoidia bacterium]|nr:hypothetical protein [Dehalococcoidia bacterium]MSQ17386.1 hypothetical protein [Dehalococcoidia bacterium]
MTVIRSPLGALGALMVLLHGIAAGALVAVRSQPVLQWMLVIMMVSLTDLITLLVLWIVWHFARTRPGLLFSPQDINPAVHGRLYLDAPPGIEFEVANSSEKPAQAGD